MTDIKAQENKLNFPQIGSVIPDLREIYLDSLIII